MNNSFVYKWTHKPTYNWYIGSRTAKNCHINDGYITSSKIVKPLILANPNEWERTIIAIGSKEDMRILESEILDLFDAKNDKKSFNQHNQDGKFVCVKHTKETKLKISANHKWAGKKRPEQSLALKGRIKSKQEIENIKNGKLGKKFTENHKKALSKAKQQGIYITPNGIFNTSREAALGNNCSKTSVLQRCHGYRCSKGKWHQPIAEWYFELKDK